MAKRILSIGASPNQVPLIKAIREQGHFALAVDINPDAPGAALADLSETVSIFDAAGIIEWTKNQRLDAVLTCSSGRAIETVSLVAQALNLAGPSLLSVQNSLNKLRWKPILERNGILTPRFGKFKPDLPRPDFPCLLKPAQGIGGEGIHYCEPSSAWPALPLDELYLFEEYLNGDVITLYGLVSESCARFLLAAKKTVPLRPDFRHLALEPTEILPDYLSLFEQVVELLGVNFAPVFQIDLVKHQQQHYVIDLGIELDPKLPSHCSLNVYQEMIKLALN